MSLDYPNRKDWLARRATPQRKPKGRYIHFSKVFYYEHAEGRLPKLVWEVHEPYRNPGKRRHGQGRIRRAAA